MAILDDVRNDLRITSNDFDTEINTAIMSAEKRLQMIGVNTIDETDPLTAQAITLYCRSWFNYQGDAERYTNAFEKLADAMALSGEYNEQEI